MNFIARGFLNWNHFVLDWYHRAGASAFGLLRFRRLDRFYMKRVSIRKISRNQVHYTIVLISLVRTTLCSKLNYQRPLKSKHISYEIQAESVSNGHWVRALPERLQFMFRRLQQSRFISPSETARGTHLARCSGRLRCVSSASPPTSFRRLN